MAFKYEDVLFDISLDPKGLNKLSNNGSKLNSVGIKHGDMLFVLPSNTASNKQKASSNKGLLVSPLLVKQDAVDDLLEKQSGVIKRGRDARFCTHGASGMCEYCLPLQPYDPRYLEENKIKHMSFHAYLRQIMEQAKTQSVSSPNFIPPLDIPEVVVKTPCPSKSHEPFPLGICTKCQPSAITLQSQNFRMVDHIEFESPAMVDGFLQFWRSSGIQRAGVLYGRYEPYSEVPLGVKAVVACIYEPPQVGGHDSIELTLPDPDEASVDALAASMGLVRVGIIYTDLTDDGSGAGTVVCKRHGDSYFLSSAECIFASRYQEKHKVASKYSPTQSFGSRFVTCVISGNTDGGIDIFSYQVSNMCSIMARENLIEASVDPSLMRVRSSTDAQYVPEVFYKYKNEYNIMVKEAAKPTFPVEYLLVTVTHGFPSAPNPTFINTNHFPVENRIGIGKQRDMMSAKQLLYPPPRAIIESLSDFHLLWFIKESNILAEDDLQFVVDVVRKRSDSMVHELGERESWNTFMLILQNTADVSQPVGGASSSSAPKPCRHCTFVNTGPNDSCEICGLPLD